MKTEKEIELNHLVDKLKREDNKYGMLSRNMQIFYWVFVVIYLVFMLESYFESRLVEDFISGISYVLSFLVLAILFGKYSKEYRTVNYALPTLVLLKKAAYRYKPFQFRSLLAFLAIGFLNIGLSFNTSLDFDPVKLQVVFWSSILLAFAGGMILWHVRYKPIRDNALQLIKEIENG